MNFRETLSSLTRNCIASAPTSTDICQPSHESSNHISSIFKTLSGMWKMLTLQVTMGINMLFTKTSQSIICDLQNFERVYFFGCGLISPFFGCTETADQKLKCEFRFFLLNIVVSSLKSFNRTWFFAQNRLKHTHLIVCAKVSASCLSQSKYQTCIGVPL